MKYFLLTTALLFFVAITYAQKTDAPNATDCRRFRNGTFKITDEKVGNFTIVRKGNIQTETKEGDSESLIFHVQWIDDCTYTLTPGEAFHKKFPMMPANVVITVNIIKTSPNSYTQRSSANFSALVLVSEMVKIK